MRQSLVLTDLLLFVAMFCAPVWATNPETDQRLNLELTTTAAVSNGDYLPFYMTNNNNGLLSPDGNQGFLRGNSKYTLKCDDYHIEAGLDLIVYASTKHNYYRHVLQLQQLYAKAAWKKYAITIGQKSKTNDRLVESTLSSGNMVLSGNARPAIGIKGGTDDFVKMRIMDDKVEGYFEGFYGRLTDGQYNRIIHTQYEKNYGNDVNQDIRHHHLIQDAWIHYASIFLRSSSEYPFGVTIGAEHAAMYGGKVDYTSQKAFKNSILATLGAKGDGKNGLLAQFNHLIAFDGKVKYNHRYWSIATYRQIYADDLGNSTFRCGFDGLMGIDLILKRNRIFRHLVAEYIQTTKQGGVVYANDVYWYDGKKTLHPTAGNSSYYHDEWYGGWAHQGLALGNPLLTSPIYNKDYYGDFAMNMIKALHIGVEGTIIEDLSYKLQFYHSKTWGTPFYPLTESKHNSSGYFGIQYEWGYWKIAANTSFDHGTIMGNQWGYGLSVVRQFELFNW